MAKFVNGVFYVVDSVLKGNVHILSLSLSLFFSFDVVSVQLNSPT